MGVGVRVGVTVTVGVGDGQTQDGWSSHTAFRHTFPSAALQTQPFSHGLLAEQLKLHPPGTGVGVNVIVGVTVKVGVGVAQIQVVVFSVHSGLTHTLFKHCKDKSPWLKQSLVWVQVSPQVCGPISKLPKQPLMVTGAKAAWGWLSGTLGATGTVANCRKRIAVITATTPNTIASVSAPMSKMVRFLFVFIFLLLFSTTSTTLISSPTLIRRGSLPGRTGTYILSPADSATGFIMANGIHDKLG